MIMIFSITSYKQKEKLNIQDYKEFQDQGIFIKEFINYLISLNVVEGMK